ncbi:histo-blood group ABO system transferase [Ambystoma mexicanum]|uniref:histo-blood group ABO system transferase n=1 Tax=Ambystoma mexicanum TaxID=8296 RepID=UPI0037E99C35
MAPARHIAPVGTTLKRWLPVIFVGLMFFTGLAWNNFPEGGWPRCASYGVIDNPLDDNYMDHVMNVQLPRMNYAQPKVLNPVRTDVLTMTPWFAPIVWEGSFNRDILNEQYKKRNISIGLTVFAVKKYVVFLQRFIETAEKFFMVGQRVNYYVFTDLPEQVPKMTLPDGRQVVTIQVPGYKRWQEVSMRRMEMIHDASMRNFVYEVDYIVAVDVDMQFTDEVGVEILGDVFGTLHPGFYETERQHFTYERRASSQAYIPEDEGDFYYAGGFFGGTVKEVFMLTGHCHSAMMADRDRGIEAIWHDESHLNKYLLNHKPTKILSPEYLWDCNTRSPPFLLKRRFLTVSKNHTQIRS